MDDNQIFTRHDEIVHLYHHFQVINNQENPIRPTAYKSDDPDIKKRYAEIENDINRILKANPIQTEAGNYTIKLLKSKLAENK